MRRSYQKHEFDRRILNEIEKLCDLDNWHAPLAIATDFAIIAVAIYIVDSVGWIVYPFSIVLIGSRQRALSTMVHEAAHGTPARSRVFARLLSTVFSGYLVLFTLAAYKASHIVQHHGQFGDEILGADYRYMIEKGVYHLRDERKYIWNICILQDRLLRIY